MFLPYGVAEDSAGNIYIADVGDHRIRKVNSAGIISTFAGTGVSGYSGDGGPAISAKIGPVAHMGIAADSAGNVYFTDEGNNRVRMVNTAGIISTVAGNGLASFSGDGGPATAAGISNPVDLALDSAGNLYIVDYGNNRIRKVALGGGASGTPAISSNGVQNGASYQPGIAANSWVQIVGTNLSPVTDTWSNSIVSGNGNLPTSLDGVRVTIGGSPAYIEYVSSTQINVLAPNVSPGPVQVIVTTPSGTSSAFTVTASEYAPAFFPWPNNQVVATHSDYSYAVATGTFAGAAPPGIPVPSGVTYNTSTLPSVTINGVAATVYAAALTSGDAGLYQVAIQVPSSLANGTWPLVVGVGGVQSTAAMVLAVQQ
jgi:uncharacterized protein (TIGR03437 family)